MYVWIYVVTSGKKPIVIDESDLKEVDDDDDDESSESISDEEEVMQMVGHWVVPYDYLTVCIYIRINFSFFNAMANMHTY